MTSLAQWNQQQNTPQSAPPVPPKLGVLGKVGLGIKQSFGLAPGGYAPIPNPIDMATGLIAPFLKAGASAVRGIQATPAVIKAIAGGFNNQGQVGDPQALQQAQQILAKPVLGQSTAAGSSNVQNLGSAAQAASFLVPELKLGLGTQGLIAGGLQGGGQAATDPNATPSSILGNTAGGAITGLTLAKAIPSILNKIENPSETTPKVPKLSPEQQDLQNNITQTQQELEQAKSQADFAAEQRKNITPEAVQGVKDINTKVSGNLKTLGTNFANDAATLEKSNPNLKLNLTNEQIDALNALKENKNFSLPDKLDNSQNPNAKLQNGYEGVKLTGKALQEYNAAQKTAQVSLSPTEAQDLIKELNRSTFRQNADGSLTKDYGRIGITNEIKSAASQAFGEPWDSIYSKYSEGRAMIDKIDSITNLDPNATPEDLNKQLEGILKQSKTPEGKLLLQQSINEYQKANGVDLNDPIKSIQQIADKQSALDEANTNLSDAQKATFKAQREADIAKLKQEQKMSTFKGRHPTLTGNLNYFTKRAAWGLTGGAIIGALGLSGLLKKIFSGN